MNERLTKYIQEHCINCKNKDTDLCEIRVSALNEITTTRCIYYERNDGIKSNKQIIRQDEL